MAIIIDFIKDYALWVYAACALAALWYLRVVILARRERRNAVFTLERETAMNRVYGAWTAAILLIVIMGLIYLLSTVVSDAIQPLVAESPSTPMTPEVASETTPRATPTLPLPEITPTHTATLRPRPPPRPQPTLAPLDTPTAAPQRPQCADPRSVIASPGVNARVSGMVTIVGTAIHADFNYYKLEYGPGANPSDSEWSFFAEGNQPVNNGALGTLNASLLPPGIYSIRITVVDASGNFPPPCQTTIVVR